MRKKSLILISTTICFAILLSACGKKPVGEVDNNVVASSAPEVKEEVKKEEVKVEEPKKEEAKQEVKKEEVKKEAPKQEVQKPAANTTTVSASKPVEQPKQVAAPVTTTTPVVTAPKITVYSYANINEQNLIRNSSDFKVTLSNTSPKIGENITVKIESIVSKNLSPSAVEVYGENMKSGAISSWAPDKKTYTGTIVIQNWKLQDGNKIDSYIFITDNDTKKQYEYRFTLNVQL